MSQSPPNTLGKYQIIREIARSNDIVYEAYDAQMNRRVAVKELAMPGGSTDQQKADRIKRFMREAKAAGSLVHPNIVTVYEVSMQAERHYLAMEFLDGDTLRKLIEKDGALLPEKAINVAVEVLKGLAFAHENGVVHRDVKPENIQILENGSIKLTDFGIARLTFEPNITMDGQVFGTPSYMSPEQINGKDIDARSDIFSVGIILYEMLAGVKPFSGDNVMAITYAIMNKDPEPIPGLDPRLWDVIRVALDKTSSMRYDSANAMKADLLKVERELNTPAPANPPPMPAQPYAAPAMQQPNLYAAQYTPYGTPNPYQQGTGAPPIQTSSPYGGAVPQPYGQPYQTPYGSPQPYGGYQNPVAIPQYYPPPPRRPLLSAEAKSSIGKFFLTLIVLGAIFGLVFVGLGAIGRTSGGAGEIPRSVENTINRVGEAADRVTRPISPAPDNTRQNETAEPPSQAPERISNTVAPTSNALLDLEGLMAQGDQMVDLGKSAERDEQTGIWSAASVSYAKAITDGGNSASSLQERAVMKFVNVADDLISEGRRQEARIALNFANSLAQGNQVLEQRVDFSYGRAIN